MQPFARSSGKVRFAPCSTPMENFDKTQLCWFAMCDLAPHNARQRAYMLLAEHNIEAFTPMHHRIVMRNGKRTRIEVPVINDLLFARSTMQVLDPLVEATPSLRYRYKRGHYLIPTTVNDAEMKRFINAVKASPATRYYLPDEITPDMFGRRVRIIGGELNGYEGHLRKCRGSNRKRLMVELTGLLFAEVEVSKDFIEFV